MCDIMRLAFTALEGSRLEEGISLIAVRCTPPERSLWPGRSYNSQRYNLDPRPTPALLITMHRQQISSRLVQRPLCSVSKSNRMRSQNGYCKRLEVPAPSSTRQTAIDVESGVVPHYRIMIMFWPHIDQLIEWLR